MNFSIYDEQEDASELLDGEGGASNSLISMSSDGREDGAGSQISSKTS